MTYRLSSAADEDMVRIFMQSEASFGMAQAEKYIAAMFKVFDKLAEFPRLARLRAEIEPPAYGHSFQSHIIFYDIDENNDIQIIRIRHTAEDWMSDMNELPHRI